VTATILNALVEHSGLSPIFARTVNRRAVQRAGVNPEAIAPSDLDRVLAEVERALHVYLGDGAEARAAAIKRELQR
jgi:hypothetical protein